MRCLKCGKNTNKILCTYCGFDISNEEFLGVASSLSVNLQSMQAGERKKHLADLVMALDGAVSKKTTAAQSSLAKAYDVIPVSFYMEIEDRFTITGRGTVVVGKVQHGSARMGDKVDIIFPDGTRRTAVITGIEMFRKRLDYTTAGDNVGVYRRGITKDELISAIGLINPGAEIYHKRFRANMTVLTKGDGGKNVPIFDHYYPWIILPSSPAPIRGMIDFDRNTAHANYIDTEMIIPGSNGSVIIELDSPDIVVPGFEFIVLEGESVKTAKGNVLEVLS